jgi:predicted transcriptional regulator
VAASLALGDFLSCSVARFRYNEAMKNPSYQRKEPIVVTERMRRQIAGAIAELDPQQLAVTRRLTPGQRVWQAASMMAAGEQVAAYRLRQREPELSEQEALRIVRGGLFEYFKAKQQKATVAQDDLLSPE